MEDPMTPTESVRPVVFVGSSTAGLDAARAVQQQLQSLRKVAQVRIWDEMVEGISQSILESLVSRLSTFDFGVLIFTPDDLVKSDSGEFFVVRDNVLIELGLCIGRLTRERTFVLAADDPKLKIPSDLGGIIYGRFKLQNRYDELLTEVGPACSTIASAIMNAGKLNTVHRLASEIESQKQKTNEQDVRLDQQGRTIEDLVKYAMSASVFHHLAGIALLKEYRYHDNNANRREFYFLRDAGYIKPRYGGFIDFDANLEGANVVDRAEPTPIGYLALRLRKGDIPQDMLADSGNLRIQPGDI
jgi:Predicted nucleotide-binding protein containing TIR-like domain